MKHTKRLLAFILTLALVCTMVVVPAAAVTSDFYHFPLVKRAYGDRYMAATVAVQRFMMVYNSGFRARLAQHGGTDGYFGDESEAVTKDFQYMRSITSDGIVGSTTWLEIGSLLRVTGVDSVGNVFAVGYAGSARNPYNWVLIYYDGYRACPESGPATPVFYPY